MTLEMPPNEPGPGPKKGGQPVVTVPSISMLTATALAVADMIGIGVFTSLASK